MVENLRCVYNRICIRNMKYHYSVKMIKLQSGCKLSTSHSHLSKRGGDTGTPSFLLQILFQKILIWKPASLITSVLKKTASKRRSCMWNGRNADTEVLQRFRNLWLIAYGIPVSMIWAYRSYARLSPSKVGVFWGALLWKQIPRQAQEVLQGYTEGGT